MFHVNRVTLLGNATRDPETHTTKAGKRLTVLGIGTVRKWTDESGAKRSAPEYHRLVCAGSLAEFAAARVRKGAALYVEGRLETGCWEDKDGTKQSGTEIIVDRMVLLSSRTMAETDPAESDE